MCILKANYKTLKSLNALLHLFLRKIRCAFDVSLIYFKYVDIRQSLWEIYFSYSSQDVSKSNDYSNMLYTLSTRLAKSSPVAM